MARGKASKVGDYYTRDRSTPQPDSFWDGEVTLVTLCPVLFCNLLPRTI